MTKEISFFHLQSIIIWMVQLTKMTVQSDVLVVYPNQRTEIKCHLNSGWNFSRWSFTAVGDTIPNVFITNEAVLNENITRKLEFDLKNPGVLVITSVVPEDAGTYTCKQLCFHASGIPDTSESNTEIIFFYRNMSGISVKKQQIVEGETITLQCTISYRGNLLPVMQWKQSDDTIVNSQINYTDLGATSTLNLIANRNVSKTKYKCTAYFNSSEMKPNVNHSRFSQTWTSPEFNILYKPEEMKISPVKEYFYVDDELTCSAEANPEATFHWKDSSSKNTFDGNPIRLMEHMTRTPSVHLDCMATNSIGNANISMSITVYKRNDLPTSTIAAIATSCLLLVLLAVLTAYLIHIKKTGADIWKLLCSSGSNNRAEEFQQPRNVGPLAHIDNDEIQPYGEYFQEKPPVPIYASVHKANPRQVPIPEIPRRKFYTGADGTEYMEVGGGERFQSADNQYTTSEAESVPLFFQNCKDFAYVLASSQ